MIGLLIKRQALSMQCAEADLISKERPSGHNHATRQQGLEWGIEPQNRHARGAEKFRTTRLRVSAATQRQDRAFSKFRCAAECGAKLLGFDLAKRGFAEAFENFRNGKAGSLFDACIEIDEPPGQLARQQRADSRLAGAHEARKT